MSEFVFKLPDLGEGTVEAEIVEWYVKPGDSVEEGDTVADVMTDKANVEVPAPVSGTILRITGEPGDVVAVGAELLAINTTSDSVPVEPPAPKLKEDIPKPPPEPEPEPEPELKQASPRTGPGKTLTSPSIRRRAAEAGVDLAAIAGTGPGGRILRRDFDAYIRDGATTLPPQSPGPAAISASSEFDAIKIMGVRRVIAKRMAQSMDEIPHFAYVEEVDVTELEALRESLNAQHDRGLTLLPFLGLALARVLKDFPQCNAHYDAETSELKQFRDMHLGIATQTPDGLKVPVVHGASNMTLWQLASAIRSVSEAARTGKARVNQLTGSTITISSLGRLGGIASTPIINYPEVAIIGVNRATQRPVVVSDRIEVRTMMNISSSFDHRFIDGFDGASLIQAVKVLLEHPAMLWMDRP